MSKQPSKKKNIIGLIIAAVLVLAALGIGYATDNEQFVLDFLLAIGLIFLAITILVTIHELGHFLTARMFGMRVETFSIGFPPRIFGVKRGDTEYQIGATPLGGYVKISGMIDESLDTDYVDKEPQPYEFRSKPVWQRLIVMLGGVVMNVILGILIFSTAKYITGDVFLPVEAVNRLGIEVAPQTIGDSLGFQTGDRLLSYNGESYPYFSDFQDMSSLQREGYYEVLREGKEIKIPISKKAINLFAEDGLQKYLFDPFIPAIISLDTSRKEAKLSPAMIAGLRSGDQIVQLDSQSISNWTDLSTYVSQLPAERNTLSVKYLRDKEEGQLIVNLDTFPDGRKRMGVGSIRAIDYFADDLIREEYGFFQAFGPGTRMAFGIVKNQAEGLSRLSESGVKTGKLINGPIEIAKVYVDIFKRGGWPGFLRLTGTLSMILALMNILPIPALDGGHVIFLLFEMVTGKEPSTKVKIIAQQIGLVIVFSLMAYLILNGVFKQF